jgi:hypothetical protein
MVVKLGQMAVKIGQMAVKAVQHHGLPLDNNTTFMYKLI